MIIFAELFSPLLVLAGIYSSTVVSIVVVWINRISCCGVSSSCKMSESRLCPGLIIRIPISSYYLFCFNCAFM